jgi:riboflavin biosynthesis pyrimidine reductase
MRQLLPAHAEDVDLEAAYAYPADLTRPWVRANMVASVDGSAVREGRSGGLSSEPDQQVFGVLRALADVVLVGAGTARTEGYDSLPPPAEPAAARAARGQGPGPVLVLVSRRLDLDPSSPLFAGEGRRTMVVTCDSSDAGRRAELARVADLVVAGDEAVDIGAALDQLAERGLPRVLCEGGPRLLADVTAAGRLDELCLTIAPRLVGSTGTRVLNGPPVDVPLALGHLLEQDGVLLARYVRG